MATRSDFGTSPASAVDDERHVVFDRLALDLDDMLALAQRLLAQAQVLGALAALVAALAKASMRSPMRSASAQP